MPTAAFLSTLANEVLRLDAASISKRAETIIDGFKITETSAPQAVIAGKNYRIFNSNDYMGLRHHPEVKSAEHIASQEFGAGPGAVRFISGSLSIHRELEKALARFHGRDDAMVFSSAFATNMAVLFSLIRGQSKDTLVSDDVLVVSDELNHRSIIDGIRIANLPSEQRAVFKHMDLADLERILAENVGKRQRVLVVTDGIFSMLGEVQDLKALKTVLSRFDAQYPQGVLLVVDDCHGVGACGATGRGTEELTGGQADVLVGTLGKAFGADGGYVVANQTIIDYLRESSATYIYSNSISPGTAGAAVMAVQLFDQPTGKQLLAQSTKNTRALRRGLLEAGFKFAAESQHPIQPLLVGDPAKSKALKKGLFDEGILVTSINYPVVPAGRDEIRLQVSAAHTDEDIKACIAAVMKVGAQLGLI